MGNLILWGFSRSEHEIQEQNSVSPFREAHVSLNVSFAHMERSLQDSVPESVMKKVFPSNPNGRCNECDAAAGPNASFRLIRFYLFTLFECSRDSLQRNSSVLLEEQPLCVQPSRAMPREGPLAGPARRSTRGERLPSTAIADEGLALRGAQGGRRRESRLESKQGRNRRCSTDP